MPATDRPPSFQFYPRDFLADPAVQAMPHVALAGYVRLLCRAWDQDVPGVLPDDDDILAVWSGLGDEAWLEHRRSIARAFLVRAGTWTQKRMVEERAAQVRRLETASQAGRAGGLQRARNQRSNKRRYSSAQAPLKQNVPLASASASAVENQNQHQSVPDSSASTSPASPAIGTDGCTQPGEAGTATATPPPDPGEVASLIAATAAAMGASVTAPSSSTVAPPDPLAELRNRALIARQLIDAGAYGIAAEQAREHIAAYEAAQREHAA